MMSTTFRRRFPSSERRSSTPDQGETVYDPFAFDVACLGNTLSMFNYLTPHTPLLAPLVDRMTTHFVANRFTASEAYAFCQRIRSSLSADGLSTPIPQVLETNKELNCWRNLPVEFVKTSSDCREMRRTFGRRVLRWIGSTDVGWYLLYWVRHALGL